MDTAATPRLARYTARTPPARTAAILRRAAAALRHTHREQALTWKPWWQANPATAPSTGAQRWVLTLDRHQLAGSHMSAPHHADPRNAA